MHSPFYIRHNIDPTKKCERCELHYSIDKENCPYCKDLNDKQVVLLKMKTRKQQKGNAKLGRLFMYVSILLAILMLALNLA